MCKGKVAQVTTPKMRIENNAINNVVDSNIAQNIANIDSRNNPIPKSNCNCISGPIPSLKLYTPISDTTPISQFKYIDATIDNVIEGINGTIIVCPKNCFVNANSTVINYNVKIELKEAFALSDMLLEKLSTTSNGNLLETDGMIYFNPTANGEQLFVNKNIPIHIEIPTKKKLLGMMAYEGVRDTSGNVNWINPKKLDTYLQTVDFSLLDFLPKGFTTEVEKNIPYKNYKVASTNLLDSLYYSLSVTKATDLTKGFNSTKVNEAYYNKNSTVMNEKYDAQSFEIKDGKQMDYAKDETSIIGIDPAIIKLIKTPAYQNTFLATREFEKRMPIIFKTCNNEILKLYVKNSNRNLHVVDAMAATFLNGSTISNDFRELEKLQETNVAAPNTNVDLLKNYYDQQLTQIKQELEAKKNILLNVLNKKNQAFAFVKKEYEEVLWKREKYRMEKYGFNWSAIGWINIDRGTVPKDWGPKRLEVEIKDYADYDQIYSYVVYTTIKSIYRLNTLDNKIFYVGNKDEKQMLMPKKKLAYCIIIAYKNNNIFAAINEFESGSAEKLFATLESISKEKIDFFLKKYDSYSDENKISKDLIYMDLFNKEKIRQKDLINESLFINQLWHLSFPYSPIDSETETN